MKKSKILFLGMLVMVLAFGFVAVGCSPDGAGNSSGGSGLVDKLSAGNIFDEDGTDKWWIKDGDTTTTILFEKANNSYFGDFLQVSYNSEASNAFEGGGASETLSDSTFEGPHKAVITAVFSANDTKLTLSGFTGTASVYNGNYTLQK
jgi:hypothetical protein